MTKILKGKTLAAQIKKDLEQEIKHLKHEPKTLLLSIILVGDNKASQLYVKRKSIFGQKLGIHVNVIKLQEKSTTEEIVKAIYAEIADNNPTGMIVQLPLPAHNNKRVILDSIPSEKDVDALGTTRTGLLAAGASNILPATPAGIIALIDQEVKDLTGKTICLIGAGDLVGKPLAIELLSRQATLIVLNEHTRDLSQFTQQADVLISAAGHPDLIQPEMVKKGAIVIDAGISFPKGRLKGDVNFDAVKPLASAITPVPGGVGPLTVATLFKNLLKLHRENRST